MKQLIFVVLLCLVVAKRAKQENCPTKITLKDYESNIRNSKGNYKLMGRTMVD